MRVASWNIQHARPNPDGSPDIGRVVEALDGLGADVYAVQELDQGRARSGRVDQPVALAAGLGGALLFAPTVDRGGRYGVGLVVRGDVRTSAVVGLSGTREPRAMLVAEVDVAGRRWSVGCTHLSRRPSFAGRQLVRAIDALAGWPAPRVLVGDLNLVPAAVLPWSTAEGYDLVEGAPTHSTRATALTRRIDHVLVQGATVTAAAVHRLPASDHCAVTADLR